MKRLFAALVLFIALPLHAQEWKESPQIGQLFNEAEVTGTFVLYDVSANRYTGFDQARAKERFVPASTFKIAHTLIGLNAGAVKSVEEVLPYGGKPQPFKAWEKDMSLREAIAASNAAIYQELARRIGPVRMADGLRKLQYGNREIGKTIDEFWLEGPLAISAIEQVQFLSKLANGVLPFPTDLQERTRQIIELEKQDGAVLYGKTGWENAPNPGIGWFVGWVLKDNKVYAFALNIDIRHSADAKTRIELAKSSLKLLGVL